MPLAAPVHALELGGGQLREVLDGLRLRDRGPHLLVEHAGHDFGDKVDIDDVGGERAAEPGAHRVVESILDPERTLGFAGTKPGDERTG